MRTVAKISAYITLGFMAALLVSPTQTTPLAKADNNQNQSTDAQQAESPEAPETPEQPEAPEAPEVKQESEAKQNQLEKAAEALKNQKEAEAQATSKQSEQKLNEANQANEQAKQQLQTTAELLKQAAEKAQEASQQADQLTTVVQTIKDAIQKTTVTKTIMIRPSNQINTVEFAQQDGSTNQISFQAQSQVGLTSFPSSAGAITIYISPDGQITIDNNNVKATTTLPLIINPVSKSLAIPTSNGNSTKIIAPAAAVKTAFSSNKIQLVNAMSLSQDTNQTVSYHLVGQQKVHLLGFLPATNAEIRSSLNAETGSITEISQPWYLHYFGWMFRREQATINSSGQSQSA